MSAVGDARKRQQERAQAGAVDGLAAVRAEALREAADCIEGEVLIVNGLGDRATTRQFHAAWLRARADRIEGGA